MEKIPVAMLTADELTRIRRQLAWSVHYYEFMAERHDMKAKKAFDAGEYEESAHQSDYKLKELALAHAYQEILHYLENPYLCPVVGPPETWPL